jgi:hypothetical protein
MKINYMEFCGIALSEGPLICFFQLYNNDFYTTIQTEPSYFLVLSHNLINCRIDMMHSDSFRFTK